VIAVAIPDAMMLPTDERFAKEVSEQVYDGSRFLLHVTDDRMRVRRHKNTAYILRRLSNGLGCISHDCKLDLVTMQGNLTGDQYSIRWPNISQICSMEFKYRLMAGQGTKVTASLWR
jgi:hypothetical protein